jgi:hypothetical protein
MMRATAVFLLAVDPKKTASRPATANVDSVSGPPVCCKRALPALLSSLSAEPVAYRPAATIPETQEISELV